MTNLKRWFWCFLILILGVLLIFFVHNRIKQNDKMIRETEHEQVHNRVINQFSIAVNEFAARVSGMRAFMNISEKLPSQKQFQNFTISQQIDLGKKDSLVVSYLDTTHAFIYSFTRDAIDPIGLIGSNVNSFRDQDEINALDHLMSTDDLRLFKPLNLMEGWLGIPINFRVKRAGRTLGYVAPIIDFRLVMESVYEDETQNKFAFHFSADGYDFDRAGIYDNSKIYSKYLDDQYYKNFSIQEAQFRYSTITLYGKDFKIGTAFKSGYKSNFYYTLILIGWFTTFSVFVIYVTWQTGRYTTINSALSSKNELLILRQEKIDLQNQELTKLNATKNRFFSIIGHDIKGPMNSIEGLIYLLSLEEGTSPNLKDLISGLGNATRNTVALLDNLLKWAMTQTGDIKFEPIEIYINSLLDEVIKTLESQASNKQIALTVKISNQIYINGDFDMLSFVIRNLVSNAIKFTESGGKVTVQVIESDSNIRIIIEDNGVGMTKKTVEKIFDLDKHLSTRGTKGEEGTGLGLLLTNDFVELHGGSIDVKSELGKGSSFIVNLPISN